MASPEPTLKQLPRLLLRFTLGWEQWQEKLRVAQSFRKHLWNKRPLEEREAPTVSALKGFPLLWGPRSPRYNPEPSPT